MLDHVRELVRVHPVRVDAAVGPEREPHAGLHAPREPVPLRLGGLVVLAQDLRGPSVLPPLLGDPVPVPDVGDQVGAARGEHRDRLVVHQRPVLDRADAGPDRPLDALGAVRVRRDVRPVEGRLVDRRPDLLLGELRRPGVVPSVRTAPVAITLIRSAPPCRIRRTASRTSSAEFATPNRSSRGTTASTSGASPVTSPPPPEHVTNAPAHRIRGPTTSPRRSRREARRRRARGTCRRRGRS